MTIRLIDSDRFIRFTKVQRGETFQATPYLLEFAE
jgi:hypothetical protein